MCMKRMGEGEGVGNCIGMHNKKIVCFIFVKKIFVLTVKVFYFLFIKLTCKLMLLFSFFLKNNQSNYSLFIWPSKLIPLCNKKTTKSKHE